MVSAKEIHREKIFNLFTQHEFVEKILSKGETKSSVILKSQIQCDMRIVDGFQFPFALNYFTGSKEHNVEMRSRAKKNGLSLNEYEFSLLDKKNKLPNCKTEKDIYKVLNLNYIPSELRENFGEFDFFENNTIELVDETMLKGTFHCHTNFSDGKNSLEDMVEKAKSLGFLYFGIADHSKVAVYANGLDEKRVMEQHKKIDELNFKQSQIKILKGTEVDILRDGSLDFSDEVLSKFDYVVASIHSSFKMSKSEMTNRIVKALKNKYVSILGHPTGRLLLERDGYEVDMNEIINVASDFGKSIEINSHPLRLDLDWRFCRYAKEKNVKIAINPDAHSIFEIENVKYGISVARKGWLEEKDVINCWKLDEVENFFSNQKR